ncbi:MAG TPA: DNA-formamidopyrimidine glycosylase family protein [Acidimicrobiales bacterium]
MPELIEVETYRRHAEAAVGRTVACVEAPDAWFLKGTTAGELEAVLPGRRIEAARRRGKLLVLDLDDGTRLGLRFGMTGRLLVAGSASIDRLEYSSGRNEPRWDRFTLHLDDGTDLRIRDPRRLGGVMLDPDEDRLGPDAPAVGPGDLDRVLASSTAPVKARLMDQGRIAGIGNLLADEILWRAGIDPARPAGQLDAAERERLLSAIHETLDVLTARGGSHTGDLRAALAADGMCPRDGARLESRRVGGRSTWSCPAHQR